MAKNQLPIFVVPWTPQKGGLQSDAALKNIQGGNFYTDKPESGAMNVRSIGAGAGITPGYQPVTGNTKISTLDPAVVQRKEFLITIDLGVVSSVNSDMDLDITSPSGLVFYHISSTVIIPPDADTCATQLMTDISTTAASLNPVMTKTVISSSQATISLYFNLNTGYDFLLSNVVGAGGIDMSVVVTQDAISAGMLGDWNLIGSCNETGDSFEFWTTKKGDTQTWDIDTVADDGTGLIQITTSLTNDFVTGEVVSIANVEGTTEANGTWMITVIDGTNFTLDLSSFSNAYTGGGIVYSKVIGLGEIGVVYQTAPDTDQYVRLLRSPQLNFSTVYQVDARSKQKQDGNIGVYFVDDNLPYRVFYYKGAYMPDGAISTINPDGQYEYGTIAESLLLFVNNSGIGIDWIDQLQTGGSVRSGNWRYACRFLNENLSPTEWSQLTNIVSVFSSDINGNPYTLLGDSPNEVTPKINVLQITNNLPNVFEYVEIAAINYVGNALQGYIIGRYVLTQEPLQEINHTGNENNVIDLDIGEVGRLTAAIKTGRNVELLDNRLVISNLVPQQIVDFTEMVKNIQWSVERASIDPIGVWEATITTPLNIAEYQTPLNIYSKMSHMMYEQYRYGFRFRMKDTGAWTPVFYPGYDIRIDRDMAQDGRVAGSFTSFDLTDGVSGAPTEVYTFYINWQNIDLGTLIDGVEAYKLIDEIQVCRAEVIPEVLASGAVALGLSGLQIIPDPSGGLGANFKMAYLNNDIGPFYFIGGSLNDPAFSVGTNPSYPQQTTGVGYNTPHRDSAFFYAPDLSFGLTSIEYRQGDQIISFGNDYRHDVQQAIPAFTKFAYSYAEFSGNSGVTANPTGYDILESKFAVAGQSGIVLNGNTHGLNIVFNVSNLVVGSQTENLLVDNCQICVTSSNIVNSGTPNTDYGFYRAIYFRPQQNKYGDPAATTYVYFDTPYKIGTQTGVIASGEVISYGDVFNQKTYLKFRTPGPYNSPCFASSINFGWGNGFAYYTQNRNNIQLRRKPDPAFSASLVIPNYPLEGWLTFGLNVTPSSYINGRDSQFYYNKGYTPKAGIISAKGFDSTFNYQTDWGNVIMWSNSEVDGSNTDRLRLFSPLDIKFLDFTQGEITDARAVNGELITMQKTIILRQYFNTTETQTTNNGSEIILGDGGVLTRKGQTLTRFGCQHKWSVIIGKTDKGFDVLYWVDWINKTVCRFGYNGNDAIDEINGMKSFFANNLTFLWNKDNPANGEGISGVANQRYREIMWTMRAINSDVPLWSDAVDYIAGNVVQFTPATYSTFEQTGEFYEAQIDNINVSPDNPTDPVTWKLIPHTDNRYYNEYTIVFNELKEVFQTFHTPKPLIYAPYKNGYLVPRPVGNTGQLYIANKGDWTTWFEDDTGAQSGDAYFDATINEPGGRKQFDNLRVESDIAPFRVEFTTPTGGTYMDNSDFVQREGNEFDGAIPNDSTTTGLNNGRTSSIYGDYLIVRLIIQATTYNWINSFSAKLRVLARMINR